MLKRGHAVTAACSACAVLAIGATPIGSAHGLAGRAAYSDPVGLHSGREVVRALGAAASCRPEPGLLLTKKQIAALAEIEQGAIDAGLHPGVFGP